MKRILITTNTRFKDYSGKGLSPAMLYVYDFNTNTIIEKIDYHIPRYNKSRSAGFRGIDYHDDKLHIATSNSKILILNCNNYEVEDEIILSNNPYEYQIHQIKNNDGILYVTGTANNRLIAIKNNIVLDNVNLSNEISNKYLHFNSIGWLPNGDMLHLYNGLNSVFNYTKDSIVFKLDSRRYDLHDICVIDNDQFIINSSFLGVTWIYNIRDNKFKSIRDLSLSSDNVWSKKGYTRGVVINKDNVFLGSNPTKLDLYNLKTNKLERLIDISNNTEEVIFDMCLHKDDWS